MDTPPKQRKFLSADALLKLLRKRFDAIPDARDQVKVVHSLADTLMSALAMFSLKDPSLLAFQERLEDQSLKNLYNIQSIPSDSSMREILDPIDVEPLNEAFADIFWELQRGGILKSFAFHDNHYLLAIDGTGYYCSAKVRCPACLEKKSKNGKTLYHHQMVAAVLVHPNRREVIPLAMEPIIKQDGVEKNDCERNATRRLLKRIKQQHPQLKLIVTEDGLSSNAPHIRDLKELKYSFILGCKPGDHAHLFSKVLEAGEGDKFHNVRSAAIDAKGSYRESSWVIDVPINASNEDVRVNFICQSDYSHDDEQLRQFTFVTDLEPDAATVGKFADGGRSRWRIENETFNTLKNQGYHFEHNYGHGTQNLSTVLATLMMLAFLIDQVQQACCPLFIAVLKKVKSRRSLWDRMRSAALAFVFRDFRELFESLLTDRCRNRALPP